MRAGLREWAERAPDRPALMIDGEEPLTYGALEARANRFAHAIGAAGLARGDHMAMLIGNSADAVALGWGAYRAGVYLTPLPTTLTPSETPARGVSGTIASHSPTGKLLRRRSRELLP